MQVKLVRQRKTNTESYHLYHLYMESKTYNKLVNKTKRKTDTQIQRIQSIVLTDGERPVEGKYRNREKREVIIELYEIMCVRLLKIVKHY